MRQPVKSLKNTSGKAVSIRPFADKSHSRINRLRRIICAGLILGILLSFNLWFPLTRTFPRAPLLIALPQNIIPAVEYLLGGLLITSLTVLIFVKRPAKYLIAVVVLIGLLVLLDQMRLQPWVYQYLLLFIVLALHDRQSSDEQSTRLCIFALQLIVATLYLWSGAQKLNYSFSREVLPQLISPLQNYLSLTQRQMFVLGLGIASIEIFTGCGLLLKETRKLCVWLAIAMHALILGLLIWRGHNSVVWAWNAALMLTVITLFWRSDSHIGRVFDDWQVASTGGRVSLALAALYAVLPILSFWGWGDMYLSGALYSGNTSVAVMRVDERVSEKLPEVAKRQIFRTKGGERMLPLFEWSMAELNVPPYPEARVFKQLARHICKLAEDGSEIELIMKGRPSILDGSYKVTRINCSQLEE